MYQDIIWHIIWHLIWHLKHINTLNQETIVLVAGFRRWRQVHGASERLWPCEHPMLFVVCRQYHLLFVCTTQSFFFGFKSGKSLHPGKKMFVQPIKS